MQNSSSPNCFPYILSMLNAIYIYSVWTVEYDGGLTVPLPNSRSSGQTRCWEPESGHSRVAAAAAEPLQSCPILCDPIDRSPPGSPVPGIRQARTLEWVAISFSNAWKWKVKVKFLSRVRLLVTPWTAAHQAPRFMGFSKQEYWSGCHCLLHIHTTTYKIGNC